MLKKHPVVMLPTNQKAKEGMIMLYPNPNKLVIINRSKINII